MPLLPIPFPALPSGGDLPLRDRADWLAKLPEHVRREETAPVRDDVAEAAAGIFLRYQDRAAYAAAQSDGTRATGIYLDGFLADAGLPRQEAEADEDARDRLYSPQRVVTPENVREAVNAVLLAAGVTIPCVIFESVLDRWFVWDGTQPLDGPHSFVTDGTVSLDPQYPDRRYDLRPNSGPGGAWAFGDHFGRWMIIRVPVITRPEFGAFAWRGEAFQVPDGLGFFVTDGTQVTGDDNGFVFSGNAEASVVYQSIVNVVERVKGYGVRVTLVIDPKL